MAMTIAVDDVLHELLATPQGNADPYPYYRELLEAGPMHRSSKDGLWYAVGYDACHHLLMDKSFGHKDNEFVLHQGVNKERLERLRKRQRRLGLSMVTENPPEHTRLRGLVSSAFTPRRVESLRPRIVELVEDYLDRMAEQREVDVMQALAFPLPVTVIGELVGVPEEHRERFRPLVMDGMAAGRPNATEEDIQRAERRGEEAEALFRELFDERRASPRDDLLTDLIAAHDEGDRLSEDELLSTAFLLFFAGFVTTTNLIGNGLLALLRSPDQLARLWTRPELVPSAVEEMLRYDSPVQLLSRSALQPAVVAGVEFAPGESTIVLIGGANRDPARFPDPDTFDVARPDNRPLSFGWGIHHCLGAPLARLEGQVVFDRLRDRFSEIELLEDAPEFSPGLGLRGLRSLHVRVHPR